MRSIASAKFDRYRALLRNPGKGAVLWTTLNATLLALVVLAAVACTSTSSNRAENVATVDLADGQGNARAAADRPVATLPGEPTSAVPIEPDDAIRGRPGALVTLVAFVDFECPFCARAHTTLQDVAASYDRADLRIVYKNNPLAFHPAARPAARAAQAVLATGGPDIYFAYATRLFTQQRSLGESNLIALAEEVGIGRGAFLAAFRSPDRDHELRRDADLARALGATGTPSFRINGATLDGAQPVEAFREAIDRELVAAQKLFAFGTPRAQIYAQRVEANLRMAGPRAEQPVARTNADADDQIVNHVPIDKSPTRGPRDALVTIVEFQDFQCPFCKRVQSSVDELLRRYAGRVRLVFKNHPLPFHARAHAAATLALEARAQKGEAGFWRAAELLWDKSPALEEADLLEIAQRLGLDQARVRNALAKDTHRAAIEADVELADDVGARGTPHFFINGRRLIGAQPIEKFTALVEQELAKSEALVKSGIPKGKLYEHVLKTAAEPSAPERKNVPAR